ncbi:MAG: GNAT family N-acetyltransferase [Hungatella sp.]|nr:GNAT family N-acetyltransferase [Hungatella sp.]
MTEYRELSEDELCPELFGEFIRHQKVVKCWRKEEGNWVIRDDPFIDDWGEREYQYLVKCLKHTVVTGGWVYGAFKDGVLKGFASVEAKRFGEKKEYLDLSCIHVSEEMRGEGIGKRMFLAAAEWARGKGAGKLYISGHSAVETQAFYKALGCVEAKEYNRKHVELEPYDCQLEFVV